MSVLLWLDAARASPVNTLFPGQRLRTGRRRAPYALHASFLKDHTSPTPMYLGGRAPWAWLTMGSFGPLPEISNVHFQETKKRNYYLTVANVPMMGT